jgi:hypothetical protein
MKRVLQAAASGCRSAQAAAVTVLALGTSGMNLFAFYLLQKPPFVRPAP